jgi:hypothetical protein
MEPKVINIEKEFGRYPAGRYAADGPYSGETFREEHLIPAIKSGAAKIIIEFDGARGYASSFLEEAFGGLVRAGYAARDLLGMLDFQSKDQSLVTEVKSYIEAQGKVSKTAV